MEGIQTTLYPRYLPQNIPRPNLSVTVVGLVIDVRENKCLSLQCDSQTKQTISIEVPSNIEIDPLKQIKYLEVRGVSNDQNLVVMRQYTDLKQNFDLKTYNQMVNLASKEFKRIFNYEE